MNGKWMDCGNPVIEKAWGEYQANPQIIRASLTKFSGRRESTLPINAAYSIVNSSIMMFEYVSDPSNPSMRLMMFKMGGNKSPQPEDHINTDFAFQMDRSPMRFDTSERNKDGRFFAMDLKLLPEYKRETPEAFSESLSVFGRVWILYGEDNSNLSQKKHRVCQSLGFAVYSNGEAW
jgi:hypothetical protein